MRAIKSGDSTITLEQTIYDRRHGCDIHLFIPTDIPLDALLGPEEYFFLNNMTFNHSYSSSQFLLPLLKSQYHLLNEESNYRSNTSLFAFHFTKSVKKERNTITTACKDKLENDEIEKMVNDFISLTNEITAKFRIVTPKNETNKAFFAQVDNYISWYVEQAYLTTGHKVPRTNELKECRLKLMRHAKLERKHREEKNYNAKATHDSPSRLTNKMRLLRKLIEHSVIINENLTTNGKRIAIKFRAGITAVLMFFVLIMMNHLRGTVEQFSFLFIFSVCSIYGLREVFKEEVMSTIWRWYNRKRAKWTFTLTDNFTKKLIGKRHIYLDYGSLKTVPKHALECKSRNKTTQEDKILHIKTRTTFEEGNFNPSFHQSQEQINIDLSPLLSLAKGKAPKYYIVENSQILEKSAERRIRLSMIVAHKNSREGNLTYNEYEIIINRRGIISVKKN